MVEDEFINYGSSDTMDTFKMEVIDNTRHTFEQGTVIPDS